MLHAARLALAGVLMAVASQAAAVSVSFTEGLRSPVPGSTVLVPTDVAATAPGFDLGSLWAVDDTIDIFGRIVASQDFYTLSSVKPMKVEFIASGFQPDTALMDKTATFTLKQGGVTIFSFDFTAPQSPIVIATNIAPGAFEFIIDGSSSAFDALYDVRFSAVPVPAAMPLLLGALAGLGLLRRRAQQQTV